MPMENKRIPVLPSGEWRTQRYENVTWKETANYFVLCNIIVIAMYQNLAYLCEEAKQTKIYPPELSTHGKHCQYQTP